jgi:hypothetical protein
MNWRAGDNGGRVICHNRAFSLTGPMLSPKLDGCTCAIPLGCIFLVLPDQIPFFDTWHLRIRDLQVGHLWRISDRCRGLADVFP